MSATPEHGGLSDPAESMTPDELRAEVRRLRGRVHEAVDECQQRHATYVSRCEQFDSWSAWARSMYDRVGDKSWTHGSEANRLLILGLIEQLETARAAGGRRE